MLSTEMSSVSSRRGDSSSNVGLWNDIFAGQEKPRPFSDTVSYALGAEWLDGLDIEDWGCGMGWMRTLVPAERYRGIDGSRSKFADEIVDLTEYRSRTPGLFMRHVLEHNPEWWKVLDNAIASFTKRMFLALFTPLSEETRDLTPWENSPNVPNFSFRLDDITSRFGGVEWEMESIPSRVHIGDRETVFRIARS
jgi:hypothetical protein